MRNLFITILNMSFSAGFVAIAVILLRLPLKKVPKVFSYALWVVVLFRLVCPFSFESAISLLMVKPDTVPQDIVYVQNPAIESGVGFVDDTVNRTIQNALLPVRPEASVNPMGIIVDIGSYIWLTGILLILVYSIFSYLRLQSRLASATLTKGNIYETDRISTPFVLGFLRPRVYLPTGLAEEEKDYILLHERTHISRRDYLIKPLGFLALTLHWFNPLIWLSYRIMCRDMEMSCDERVLGQYGEDIRAKYSGSLLSLSMKQSGFLAPLAFGEPDTKFRIKNVLNYKKPVFWVSIVSVIVLVLAGFCLIANPPKPAEEMSYAEKLLQYRTEYVGDNSKVGGIVSELEYPEGVGYNFFQLFTGSPPLSITVRLDADTDTRNFYTGAVNQGTFQKNATILFALVGNVEYVSFELDDGVNEPYLMQYTRQWAEDNFNSLWEQSASLQAFERLLYRIERMSERMDSLSNSTVIVGDSMQAGVRIYSVELADSISINNGTVSFTIPQDIPEEYRLFVHVSGFVPITEDSGTSVHAFENESEMGEWQSGKTYYEQMFNGEITDGTEILFTIELLDETGDAVKITDDIIELVNADYYYIDGKAVRTVSKVNFEDVIATMQKTAGENYNNTVGADEFLVPTAHGHAVFVQGNLIKGFASIYNDVYADSEGNAILVNEEELLAAVVYMQGADGSYTLKSYETIAGGQGNIKSFEKYCNYPANGMKIPRLSNQIERFYTERVDVSGEREKSLTAYLEEHNFR